MNENKFRLRMLVQDDDLAYRKIYVRNKNGNDWQIVLVETGHWFAVNSRTGQLRLNKFFRNLEQKMPIFASRIKHNIIDGLMLA